MREQGGGGKECGAVPLALFATHLPDPVHLFFLDVNLVEELVKELVDLLVHEGAAVAEERVRTFGLGSLGRTRATAAAVLFVDFGLQLTNWLCVQNHRHINNPLRGSLLACLITWNAQLLGCCITWVEAWLSYSANCGLAHVCFGGRGKQRGFCTGKVLKPAD